MNDTLEPMVTQNDPEFLEKYKSDKLANKVLLIDAKLAPNVSGFFVGDSITLADIYVLTFVHDYFL